MSPDTNNSTLSPRPGPLNDQASARVLHPIYQALDTHNYTKALKLTSVAPQNEWDIVRALRVHALGRSGKKREALVLLWEVIVKNVVLPGTENNSVVKKTEEVWSELYEKIASLSDAKDILNDVSNDVGLNLQLLDAVQLLDAHAYAPVIISSSPDPAPKVAATPSGKSASKTKGKASKSKGNASKSKAVNKNLSFPPVTDETVLSTLAVTLRLEGMSDTLSELYFQAMESGCDEHVLEEAACIHFQAACDCMELKVAGDEIKAKSEGVLWQLHAHLPKLEILLNLTKYYERMQSSSLQLAKLSGESLHFQWTAVSSLWYSEGIQQLVVLLEMFHATLDSMDDSNEDVKHIKGLVSKMVEVPEVNELPSKCQKLRQKLMLLPRLAESISTRVVSKPDGNVSENDWDVYLETLLVQGKKDEALKVLETIECTPMTMDKSLTGVLPVIDDENTIETHVGSILPYTQRKKLERIASLSLELSRHELAEECYKELLGCFPDQWTYWLGLLDACTKGEQPTQECLEKCQSFVEEILANDTQNHPTRGPHLFLVELASLKVKNVSKNEKRMEESVALLREEICNYGNKFAPRASCCFSDLRPYLCILCKTGPQGDSSFSNDTKLILEWAKAMWMNNSQSVDSAGAELSHEEARERRSKLREYIFAIQVIYCMAAEFDDLTLQVIDGYAPVNEIIASEWRSSLTCLPGVAPKDGGQKEVLPGDELVLLLAQNSQKRASEKVPDNSSTPLLEAIALLEEAMDNSPYNPHLKIAAMDVYLQLGASHRALSIYQDLGVKQIQIDSCSYLILPSLITGGLYTSAARLSSSILRLHSSTSKDIKDFASKALQNGYLFKAKEMATFQRAKMRPSLQLLHAKGIVMDCASLVNANDFEELSTGEDISAVKLGSENGLHGGNQDIIRSGRIAIDGNNFYNAPHIIHEASNADGVCVYSDNRDMDINYFQILHRKQNLTENNMVNDSIRKGLMHGLVVRAVMAVDVAKAPKKGKAPKVTEEAAYRCQSLARALEKATHSLLGTSHTEGIGESLWDVFSHLCQVIGVVISGGDQNDTATLAERENAAVKLLKAAELYIDEAKTRFVGGDSPQGALVCQLLPAHIVPIYTMIGTTSRLFALFGWGKRKRLTKAAAGGLASLAHSFRLLVSELLQAMVQHRSVEFVPCNETKLVQPETIRRVVNEISQSRKMTKDRVDPFLNEMMIELATYDEEE